MIQNLKLENLVSIGITSKNRWEDLRVGLNKIIEAGLEALPIIIIDDGSGLSCPFDLETLPFQDLQFQKFSTSEGLIVRRNQIAKAIQTKYYLSLDDDSYPVLGSLKAAVEFAETRIDLLCLSFPIYNPIQKKYENSSIMQEPYQVRSFIGCGHLLHCERFLTLGGYRSELIHQGEEMEIAARAFQQGLHCYHFPDFLIHHTASNRGRNWWRMDYYGSRNNVLWNDWFVPQRLKALKQIRTLISRLLLSFKVRRLGLIQGEIVGLIDMFKLQNNRQTMSWTFFKKWQNLPYS